MPQYTVPNYLEQAFNKGFTYTDDAKNLYQFYTKDIGNLKIADGRIIVCDPFMFTGEAPLETQFPVGEFPVQLAIAAINTDERVGFARIKFSNQDAADWKIASWEGQDAETLTDDQIIGYGVDSGTGAFMDTSGGKEFAAFLDADDKNFEVLTEEMNNTYQPTRSWLLWGKNNVNAALFSAGWGDGFYASYIGYDANGNICRLVTDFQVIY